MRTAPGITVIAAAFFSLSGGSGYSQQPALEMLFRMTLQNEIRSSLTPTSVTMPNVDLQVYGDGQNIVVATGTDAYFPRLFFGLCRGPCGFTLRDRENHFDLRGRARIRFTTIVSGFHRLRPIIRLVDGTLLIGDQGVGSTADWHQYDISFGDCRWLRLDPVRGVTLGGTWVEPDLGHVEEVGYFDVIPGSDLWADESLPAEQQPPSEGGGWIAVSEFELWATPIPRIQQ